MKTERNTRPGLAACSSLLLLATAATSSAATLVLNDVVFYDTTMSEPVDLNPSSTIDWSYWENSSSTPTDSKAGGTAIGDLTAYPSGSFRSSANSVGRYSWSDGTSTSIVTDRSGGLVFNNTLGPGGIGSGFNITIAGDPNETRSAVLYFGAFKTNATLTLELNGEIITDTRYFEVTSSNNKQVAAYHITFRPDSAGDVLNISYTSSGGNASGVTGTTNSSAHVGIDAITVQVIPEPSAALLGGLGSLLLLGRRRR